MAGIDQPSVISDAGPIIHLDELAALDLLSDFRAVMIPRQVWSEIVRHRPRLTLDEVPGACLVDVTNGPSPRLRALANSLSLDVGEIAALALMEDRGTPLLLCDDASARLAAESLGCVVHGTIGVLVRSIRTGKRSHAEILAILRSLPQQSSLHISGNLLAAIIAKIDQEHGR